MSTQTSVERDIALLAARDHHEPHRILGAHPSADGVVVRVWWPEAESVKVIVDDGEPLELPHRASGLWEVVIPGATEVPRYELEVAHQGRVQRTRDPYSFLPTLGELDLHLVGEGRHHDLWERLGAHLKTVDGAEGTAFAVWAPSARSVSVVGDWNSWDGRIHPMRSLGSSGIWELFVPGVGPGAHYKYEIRGADGGLRLKADPMATAAEMPPRTASTVFESQHPWRDGAWIESRAARRPHAEPVSIYEVHLGSWRGTSVAPGIIASHSPDARCGRSRGSPPSTITFTDSASGHQTRTTTPSAVGCAPRIRWGSWWSRAARSAMSRSTLVCVLMAPPSGRVRWSVPGRGARSSRRPTSGRCPR